MLVHIPGILSREQVSACRKVLDAAPWLDGRTSAGSTAARAKNNSEASFADPGVAQWSEEIRRALKTNRDFVARALPAKICPPSFNRYGEGQGYGEHNDGALIDFSRTADPLWVRSDLAATLFLSDPADYDGGELVIADTFGEQRCKLPAGDLVLYPASSQHRIETVTRGARVAAYFWIQSLVRDDARRRILQEMDGAISQLTAELPDHAAPRRLLGAYHNLLRLWSET
jgi:PKHD-type hydroxylase